MSSAWQFPPDTVAAASDALLRAAEQDALARGITAVRLASGAERTQAHQFYQSCGCLPHKQQLKFHKSLVPAGDSAGPSALRREV